MNRAIAAALPPTAAPSGGRALWLGEPPPRRGLLIALATSIAIHIAFSFWPAESPTVPDEVPLQATITEMPPPPTVAPVATAKPRPRPKRATAPPPPVAPPDVASATAGDEPPEAPAIEPTAEAIAMGPEAPTEVVPLQPASTPEKPPVTLPRRVDLVYKAFLGTNGFLIGEAVYRFEHAANEYRITTIGEAKGLAALFIRGQGRVESHGYITATGLQPLEFAVERGSKERRETALFDWEAGIVTLHEQKTETLDASTYDPLTLMWQAYFSPPVDDTQTISVATTRRLARYTLHREGVEKLPWGDGTIDTERWHRKSDDGATDTIMWLAPSMHYLPMKVRVTATYRGTIEAALDSIRVDEPIAQQ